MAPTDGSLSLRFGALPPWLDLFPPDQAFPALYTSLAPAIAIWERVRRSAARNLVYLQNNALSELRADLSRTLGISDPAAEGLTTADLTGPDHQLCPELGAAAMGLGDEALLVTSAALPGLSLVVLPRTLPELPPTRLLRSTGLPLDRIVQGQREEALGEDRLIPKWRTPMMFDFGNSRVLRPLLTHAVSGGVFLCSYRDTVIDEFKLEHRYQSL